VSEVRQAEGSRERLLEAAARVYARAGLAGTTTRRVAEAAGVNEITLFRHFGTKERLIAEAIRIHGGEPAGPGLPDLPRDPIGELAVWCQAHLDRLRAVRGVLRRCLNEPGHIPDVDASAQTGLEQAAAGLERYVAALQRGGLVAQGARAETAVAMLLSALLVDALARDDFPGLFRGNPEDAGREYARGFLDALRGG
jgi:AcrR family transcriptional regulator